MTRPSDDPPAAIPASHQLGDPHRQTPACNDRPTTLAQVDSDIFLGRLRATWAYETPRDYYVPQLWDWNLGAEAETMPPARPAVYGTLCGWTLARASRARAGCGTTPRRQRRERRAR
jgi:Uncharacterized protein conserved in bacteria (DUF2252)